jgi:hypothetical protein
MEPRITVITCSIRPKGLEITQKCLAEQTFQDFEWIQEISIPEKGHDLNAAYNRALRRAKGELIVSLQDYIKVTPQYLEKMWQAYQENPNTFITAPVGKTDKEDYSGSPRWDWRAYSDAKCIWNTWEIDSGAAPLSCLKKIGGFDEELDGSWSADNVSVGWRAHLAGYKFMHLPFNPAVAYDHDAFIEHPFRKSFDPTLNNMRMTLVSIGDIKIDYLH